MNFGELLDELHDVETKLYHMNLYASKMSFGMNDGQPPQEQHQQPQPPQEQHQQPQPQPQQEQQPEQPQPPQQPHLQPLVGGHVVPLNLDNGPAAPGFGNSV